MSGITTWRALLGTHPATRAIRQGRVSSPRLALSFADVPVPNKAFKRVVRDLEFDVAEIALMTFLMARSRGVTLKLLPVVVFSRNPLPYLVCDLERRRIVPGDLGEARIGVRSYTTTTAVWLRAVLSDQFGVSFDGAAWTTAEEGHVANVADPPNVRCVPDADLIAMLREGALDAVIVDPVPAEDRFGSVVPDPERHYQSWQARHGALAVNHMICVREFLAHDEPAMRDLFELFRESRAQAGESLDRSTAPLGLEANRRSLAAAIDAASAQGLLARRLSVDELVTDVIAALA